VRQVHATKILLEILVCARRMLLATPLTTLDGTAIGRQTHVARMHIRPARKLWGTQSQDLTLTNCMRGVWLFAGMATASTARRKKHK
jgi:hypothetical protein